VRLLQTASKARDRPRKKKAPRFPEWNSDNFLDEDEDFNESDGGGEFQALQQAPGITTAVSRCAPDCNRDTALLKGGMGLFLAAIKQYCSPLACSKRSTAQSRQAATADHAPGRAPPQHTVIQIKGRLH
jgi:hypothetical protein